jgi:DNA-binding beta-propeller fold protein YncE
MKRSLALIPIAGLLAAGSPLPAQTPSADAPYRVLQAANVGGDGGFDYVTADSENRRLYVPRGDRVTIFDIDSLNQEGQISDARSVHGVAIDPVSHHAFSSSRPVVMWDSRTLTPLKKIDVQGSPDGILYEPATERIYILSHRAPNVTVLDGRDGSIVGTIDLGAAPEQAASDGQGHVWIDLEDKDQIAVVDAKALAVTGHYDLAGKGGGPGGLALDAKNRILFALCHDPATCVVLNADTGMILATLPIGKGTDGGAFNPNTLEAFSTQGDGTMTVIKEDSPTSFSVEQTVPTRPGARTLTLDTLTNRIYTITAQYGPPPAAPAAGAPPANGGPRRPRRGPMVPGSFTILSIGR